MRSVHRQRREQFPAGFQDGQEVFGERLGRKEHLISPLLLLLSTMPLSLLHVLFLVSHENICQAFMQGLPGSFFFLMSEEQQMEGFLPRPYCF